MSELPISLVTYWRSGPLFLYGLDMVLFLVKTYHLDCLSGKDIPSLSLCKPNNPIPDPSLESASISMILSVLLCAGFSLG